MQNTVMDIDEYCLLKDIKGIESNICQISWESAAVYYGDLLCNNRLCLKFTFISLFPNFFPYHCQLNIKLLSAKSHASLLVLFFQT